MLYLKSVCYDLYCSLFLTTITSVNTQVVFSLAQMVSGIRYKNVTPEGQTEKVSKTWN